MNMHSVKYGSQINNFLNNQQNDFKVLKLVMKYIRWIGVTPLSLKANSIHRILTKCILPIFMVAYSVCECINFKLQFQHDNEQINDSGVIYIPLKTTWHVSNLILFVVCVAKPNFFQLEHWKRFFTTLDEVEAMVNDFDFQETRSFSLIFSETFGYIIITIAIHICHIADLALLGKSHKIFSYIGWSISHFYMASILSFLRLLAKIIEKRYTQLNHVLIRLQDVTSRDAVFEVLRILQALKKFRLLIEETNKIFGLQIFLCVFIIFISIVAFLSYVILDVQNSHLSVIYVVILTILMYFVSIF